MNKFLYSDARRLVPSKQQGTGSKASNLGAEAVAEPSGCGSMRYSVLVTYSRIKEP